MIINIVKMSKKEISILINSELHYFKKIVKWYFYIYISIYLFVAVNQNGNYKINL